MNYLTKSKIFLYLCLSFSFGVFIASFLKIPVLVLFAAAIAAVIFISIFWRKKKITIVCFAAIFVILGIYRFQAVSEKANTENIYGDLNKSVIFQGLIVTEPDNRIKDTQYVVENQDLKIKNQNYGKILVTMPHYPAYQYGDLVEIEGKLKIPEKFNSFDYQEYLAKDDIYFTMYSPKTSFISSGLGNPVYSAIFSFKNVFKERIGRLLAEPEVSLLNGLLLGERSGMGEKLKNDFSITGTSHIVAVSGFNVTIIAIIILELCLFAGFSRNQAFWVSLLAIISFIIMVSAPSSAIRAGIMSGLVMVAIRAGRLNTISTAIVFAATLMIAVNPKILRFDVGFQLSFLAVMGLVWVYPILDHYLKKLPDVLKIKSMLLITISAQIMALPVLIYNFDRLSIVSPLANILILPFVPLAMALGFLAGIFSFIWIVPAKIIGYFTWIILTYQIRTIEYLASLPWASVEIFNFGIGSFVVYYMIVLAVIVWDWRKRESVKI
ncbi:MAG: ComEC/Rec2 family competence protein [bacterium]|nr:ComEC/Rec2 family competence protein [bacterium]